MYQILASAAGSQTTGTESMLLMLLLAAAMIFFMWFSGRKQRKQQKEMAERRNNLKKGDRVMMTSGIFGVVSELEDNVITILVGTQKVPLVFSRSAVSVVEYDDDSVDHSKEEAKKLEKE